MTRVQISGSLWGDVFSLPNGLIGCAYDLSRSVKIDYYEFIDALVLRGTSEFTFTERVLFVRADVTLNGNVVVMGQGNDTGKFLTRGLATTPQLSTYGTHVCDLVPISADDMHYVVIHSPTQYYDSLKGDLEVPFNLRGTSQGFIQLVANEAEPRWADEWRMSVEEMYYPFLAGSVYCGEGRLDPAHVQALEGLVQKNIYEGVMERPRACYNPVSNVYAICGKTPQGTTFSFYHPPLPDYSVPVPEPIPPDPVPPNGGGMNESYQPVPTSDEELTILAQRLDLKYQAPPDQGGLGRGPTPTYVDQLGHSRWRRDYFYYRDKGYTPNDAWHRVNQAINDIVGISGDPNFP